MSIVSQPASSGKLSLACYICGEDTQPPAKIPAGLCEPTVVGFINGGVTLCANCEGRIQRNGHKGHRIPNHNRIHRAFTDKQADAFVDRFHVRVDCVYDYSAEG